MTNKSKPSKRVMSKARTRSLKSDRKFLVYLAGYHNNYSLIYYDRVISQCYMFGVKIPRSLRKYISS